VTGDDFGLSVGVNEAIEEAHARGILTSASLMVGSPAAEDAVARARRNPSLRVGLHVVVVRGAPVLLRNRIDRIVDADGMLRRDMVRASFRWALDGRARAQLRDEIEAQFEAYRATGLPLDHVDAHNHLHVHPIVFDMLLDIGPRYGMRALRIPHEPARASWQAGGDRFFARAVWPLFLAPWMHRMRRRARRAGMITNDLIFGMRDSGHVTGDRIYGYLRAMPHGVAEIYSHPAAASEGGDPSAASYDHAGELAALLDPGLRRAVEAADVSLVAYGDLVATAL
jgi:hopanoid biosynthesis associated protein HpnK